MKRIIHTLVQSPYTTPLGFLFFIVIFAAVHLIAFIFQKYSLLTLYYPLLFLVLTIKMYTDRK